MAIKSFLRSLLWWKHRPQQLTTGNAATTATTPTAVVESGPHLSASYCARCLRATTATTLAAAAEEEAHEKGTTTVVSEATTMTTTLRLDLLPDSAAHVLAEFLDISSLCYLTYLLRDATTAMSDVFSRRVRLCVPIVTPHNKRLASRLDPQQLPLLPTQFGLDDSWLTNTLLRGHHRRIRGLRLDGQRCSSSPWPLHYGALASLRCLVHLEIYCPPVIMYNNWDDLHGQLSIDLRRLSVSVPQLETLSIEHAHHIQNQLDLPELRVLRLVDTNITSFAVATQLPKLTSLSLLASPRYPRLPQLDDVASLARIAPLECLVVRGQWAECPNAALESHRKTLRTFAQVDVTCMFTMAPLPLPRVAFTMMTQIRSLRLGRQPMDDLSPLVALKGLEHLQLVVASTVPHCRHLRALINLCELQLSRGWVMDIVGFLPHLDKLVCEQDYEQSGIRGRGHIRLASDAQARGLLTHPAGGRSLRKLVLRGKVSIDMADPVVSQWIHHVNQIELCQLERDTAMALLETVRRLPHLKRIAFRDCVLPSHLGNHPFACVESLEELYIDNKKYHPENVHLPDWLLTRASKLRVLASHGGPLQRQMSEQIQLPSLTHLYIPLEHSYVCWRQLFALHNLQVISICVNIDCMPFRNECGPGRSLPALQRILHSMTDCLWSPECMRWPSPYYAGARGLHEKYVRKTLLVAPWSHPWEPSDLREIDGDEWQRRFWF